MTSAAAVTAAPNISRDTEQAMSPGLPSAVPARWQSKLLAVFNGPAFAYLTILLLQLKRIWGLWDYRDLTVGDTAHYFAYGHQWLQHRHVDFAWSPLYTAFYGSLLRFSNDACFVTSLHRLVIVLLAVALVLAVLRQMLPHPIAWLTAAWWAVLSVNHNTQYEIHLFSLLPILVAWLVIMRGSGPWSRGIGLAILLAATLLVRNELIVAVVCWGGACLVIEWRAVRRAAGNPARWGQMILAYAVPAALACGLSGYFYSRSIVKGDELIAEMSIKHRLNMAQVYAFGYRQRHHEWTLDPWTGYGNLCQRDFGTPLPNFRQMLARNPRAAAEHFGWNLRLLPGGLQLLLFDVYSGPFTPDYQPIQAQPVLARAYSAAALILCSAGMIAFWRRRRWWWETWFKSRATGWAAMLAVAVVACLVVPTQRPRPSYLFAQGVVLMTGVATCAYIVLATLFRRWPSAGGIASRLMPAFMLVLPAITRSPYAVGTRASDRPVQQAYYELLPFADSIRRSHGILVKDDSADALKEYIGFGDGTFLGYSVLGQRMADERLGAFLDRKGVEFFHVDEECWAQLEVEDPGCLQDLMKNGEASGWWLVAFEDTGSRWLLFRRAAPEPVAVGTPPWRTPAHSGGFGPPPGTAMYSGLRAVSGLGRAEILSQQSLIVRWGLWPATRLVPRDTAGGRFLLMMKGIAPTDGQSVTVLLDGKAAATYSIATAADLHEVAVPLDLSPGPHVIELVYAKRSPHDTEVLFYELRLAREDRQ